MDPNRAFRQKKQTVGKKKCKTCGRTWSQHIDVCLCGNTTRWISSVPPGTKGFHVWECREYGYKQNLFGTVIDGHKHLLNHGSCENCGHGRGPNNWDCIS